MSKQYNTPKPDSKAIVTDPTPRSTGRTWEVLIDEAADESQGYQAVCPALDLTVTAPDKAAVMQAITRRIESLLGQPGPHHVTFVDLDARREAGDESAARAAEARYRAMGTAELVSFDTFVHPSDAHQ